MSAVSHSRHVCCVTPQPCLLCDKADVSAVSRSICVCCATQMNPPTRDYFFSGSRDQLGYCQTTWSIHHSITAWSIHKPFNSFTYGLIAPLIHCVIRWLAVWFIRYLFTHLIHLSQDQWNYSLANWWMAQALNYLANPFNWLLTYCLA